MKNIQFPTDDDKFQLKGFFTHLLLISNKYLSTRKCLFSFLLLFFLLWKPIQFPLQWAIFSYDANDLKIMTHTATENLAIKYRFSFLYCQKVNRNNDNNKGNWHFLMKENEETSFIKLDLNNVWERRKEKKWKLFFYPFPHLLGAFFVALPQFFPDTHNHLNFNSIINTKSIGKIIELI